MTESRSMVVWGQGGREPPSPYLYIKAPSIQDGCFYNVQNIERVICDRSVKSIGESAFASSSIDYIDTGGSESIGPPAVRSGGYASGNR